jgi:hypothetical protein
MLHHEHVQVALILHGSSFPEKVDVNQVGVNHNVIPIENNEIRRIYRQPYQ